MFHERLTTREMVNKCNISFGSCQEILRKKLRVSCVTIKFVPQLITENHKQHRVEVLEDFVERADNNDTFLKNIIAGDKTWVYKYDIKIKVHSSQWKRKHSPRPKKVRQSRSNVKVKLNVFFYL